MKKTLFLILYIHALFLFAQQALSELQRPEQVSVRLSGIGAPFTTMEAGIDTLFTNPASFAFLKKTWQAGRLAVSVNSNVLDAANILTAEDREDAFNSYLYKKNGLLFDFNATGPLSLAIADKNFAAGIFNRTFVYANVDTQFLKQFLLGEEIFLTAGYGGTVYDDDTNKIALGIQMKGFFQTFAYAFLMQNNEVTKTVKAGFKNLPINLSNGIGVDAGFLYKYENYFFLGLTVRDLYTPVFSTGYADFNSYAKSRPSGKTRYNAFLPDISIGIGSMPIQNHVWKTVSSWAFYLDYRNLLQPVFDRKRNPLLNAAFGTELLFQDVLALRLGLSEAYPHAGFGLNFTYFKLDFSVYAREKGDKPWQKPVPYMDFALSFEY